MASHQHVKSPSISVSKRIWAFRGTVMTEFYLPLFVMVIILHIPPTSKIRIFLYFPTQNPKNRQFPFDIFQITPLGFYLISERCHFAIMVTFWRKFDWLKVVQTRHSGTKVLYCSIILWLAMDCTIKPIFYIFTEMSTCPFHQISLAHIAWCGTWKKKMKINVLHIYNFASTKELVLGFRSPNNSRITSRTSNVC